MSLSRTAAALAISLAVVTPAVACGRGGGEPAQPTTSPSPTTPAVPNDVPWQGSDAFGNRTPS